MKNAPEHRRILAFLRAVRESFPDAAIIYTHGACFGLYRMLRQVFPSARPYLTDNHEHVVSRINGRFYDVFGECVRSDGTPKYALKAMTPAQLEYWSAVVAGQRVEYMLKKYNA